MKRIVCILMALVLSAAFWSVSVSAETYDLSDTDMSIRLDDTVWYVFTRDNIEHNAELEELGISYDAIHDILYNSDIYMDAIVYYKDGTYLEFFVRKKAMHAGSINLTERPDDQVLTMAKIRAQQYGAETYSVYKNQYKFAKLEYFDGNEQYHVCEYVTIVNKTNYVFTFQSKAAFTQWESAQMEEIIDSIQFDMDTAVEEKDEDSFWDYVLPRTIGGAVIGGAVGGVLEIRKIRKKKKAGQEETPLTDTTEAE